MKIYENRKRAACYPILGSASVMRRGVWGTEPPHRRPPWSKNAHLRSLWGYLDVILESSLGHLDVNWRSSGSHLE